MKGLKPSENSEKPAGTGASSCHGVPERMMKAIIEACREFLELPEEEKRGISGKHVLDPIRFGTSFNESVDEILCWRDYVKIFQHPEFHSPNKPPSFREIALEYSKRVRLVAREIIRGISESLGLEKDYIYETLNPENGLQLIAANLYPPCPQPELAMGLPPHSDHGLLTLLIQNQIGGLQVQHKGKWVNIDPIPNSFLANIGDHIEILSNGKYKSVLHRAVVNNRDVRISIAVPHGPALDAIFSPDSKLVENVGNPPAYGAMKYKEYLEFQQGTMLNGKSFLERIRNRV
ncbi:2-oxoglutarate-dependent dioxygenase 19 isoform X3 [Gossypium hirsutum]|uniref:2-oxoglutarate-dependent dioxygenase 19 isoform X3 n=1 Tax=Gossypium hirsutum TaxID=3635 RepID=A0ABM2ZD80_GOSHI|nr:2-oxoglutarate-dependent dioxygenase 19 isoform X3 [Gossypium hirsutum]